MVLIENNSSVFSKKFKSLKGEAIKSRTFNNPLSTGGGDIVKSFRSGFKSLCKTFLSRLESRRCKPACYNGKCYNFCSQVKESCTYQIHVTSSQNYKFFRKKKLIIRNTIIDFFPVDIHIVVQYQRINVNFRETQREKVKERTNVKVVNEVHY